MDAWMQKYLDQSYPRMVHEAGGKTFVAVAPDLVGLLISVLSDEVNNPGLVYAAMVDDSAMDRFVAACEMAAKLHDDERRDKRMELLMAFIRVRNRMHAMHRVRETAACRN